MSIDVVSSDGICGADPCRAAFARRVQRNRHRSAGEMLDDLGAAFALAPEVIAGLCGLDDQDLRVARSTGHVADAAQHGRVVELFALCQTVEDVLGVSVSAWLPPAARVDDLLDGVRRELHTTYLVA
ncbi:hypothetical protein [Luteipulveratus flavus]|uniref:Uncharacterized protein n=1 Tax=Luteipulveratus flavus TaxID=3031728 RepID=A0ABT6C373_9MICO|nr:hypothetical protein [Luteipulveratus sp. YIM 133296]MDF8262742.1 hypothetical protein [Luteipulveratus sp. YIM 133296]